MKIKDLLSLGAISLESNPKDKNEAILEAVKLMEANGNIEDSKAYTELVLNREKEGTTGLGGGIAIPHGKGSCVTKPALAAMVVKNGVDYEALDGEPVKLVFLIAAPNTKDNVHLDVLSKLAVMLMEESFIQSLTNAKTKEEFLSIIDNAEKDKDSTGATSTSVNTSINILAVTSCPTGIAHTYMAAESLQKAAKAKNCNIKVETRGSGGAKNVLTDAEIAKADCIICACDSVVPMDRFNGKKVIECQVADGIKKADVLIDKAIKGEVQVYQAKNAKQSNQSAKQGGSAAHKIYTQLMNGVSHMLPFVVGGGILIAIAFLIDGLMVDMNSLDQAARGNFGSITPMAAMFKNIGGTAFAFMLPVLAGYIAMAIGDRPALAVGFVGGMMAASGTSGFLGALIAGFAAGYIILALQKACEKLPEALEKIAPVLIYPVIGILLIGLAMNFFVEPVFGGLNTGINNALASLSGTSKVALGFLLGGMMAIDMGGPFNKAAYVFGTAAIAAGNYDIMAAVMIGGMVPTCAIALSTILFKNKYTKEERDNGPMNFVMGLAFITEGAIPYAAADPIHVLPACIIGSGLAGALSMLFGCTLMAPHGGIFVVPVMGNWLMYLVALVVGTVVSAVLLGTFKKTVIE